MDSPGGVADVFVVVVVVAEDDDAAAVALTEVDASVDTVGIGKDISILLPISVHLSGVRAARARRTCICRAGLELCASKNLVARMAWGTFRNGAFFRIDAAAFTLF